MNLDAFFEIFGDKTTRCILEILKERGRADHSDLLDYLKIDSTELSERCGRLEMWGLVEKTTNYLAKPRYLITADGLSAYRKFKKFVE